MKRRPAKTGNRLKVKKEALRDLSRTQLGSVGGGGETEGEGEGPVTRNGAQDSRCCPTK